MLEQPGCRPIKVLHSRILGVVAGNAMQTYVIEIQNSILLIEDPIFVAYALRRLYSL